MLMFDINIWEKVSINFNYFGPFFCVLFYLFIKKYEKD